MENYIVINGKKAELTAEQLKALGIETKKRTIFDKVEEGGVYYYIDSCGNTIRDFDDTPICDGARYDIANYCTDKALMEQRALHETLNRLLWRFSMTHNGHKLDWSNNSALKYFICYNNSESCFSTDWHAVGKSCNIYFHTRQIAEQAIEEIIKPFMAEHPDFKW